MWTKLLIIRSLASVELALLILDGACAKRDVDCISGKGDRDMVGSAKLFYSRLNFIDYPTISQARSPKSAGQPFVTDRIEPPRRCTLCSVEVRLLKGTTDT